MADGKTYYISSNDTAQRPTLEENIDKVKKSNVSFLTIDGRKAKILSPVQPGLGTTGIYIDSLWGEGNHRDRFNLYGTNLKPENEKALLIAFRTLKFHYKK